MTRHIRAKHYEKKNSGITSEPFEPIVFENVQS